MQTGMAFDSIQYREGFYFVIATANNSTNAGHAADLIV